MPKVNFENLRIYQLAEQLSDHIWNSVATWDGFSKDPVGRQLVRAADSIGANIAEGSGRGSSQGLPKVLEDFERVTLRNASLVAARIPTKASFSKTNKGDQIDHQ